MADFVTNAVPPLIPGDNELANSNTNTYAKILTQLQIPVYTSSAGVLYPSLPAANLVPIGALVLDMGVPCLKVALTGSWLTVT